MCKKTCANCNHRVPELFGDAWKEESTTFDGLHCADYQTIFFLTFDGKKCIGWEEQTGEYCDLMEQYMRR